MSDGSDDVGWNEAGDDVGQDGDDVGQSGDTASEQFDDADGGRPDDEDEEYEPSIAGVFGARPEDAPPRPEIVPETPELENVVFVLLGVLLGCFVIYRAAVVFGG